MIPQMPSKPDMSDYSFWGCRCRNVYISSHNAVFATLLGAKHTFHDGMRDFQLSLLHVDDEAVKATRDVLNGHM